MELNLNCKLHKKCWYFTAYVRPFIRRWPKSKSWSKLKKFSIWQLSTWQRNF